MTQRPTLWGRLLCHIHGEVPADTLEAYRRASLAVYEILEQLEQQRAACKARGVHPWAVPAATQAALLCAWNASTLQTLGDEMLDADDAWDPATVGYVPAVTAEQVLAFYSQVEGWLSRARQAESNPNYQLDIAVPADLPPWSAVEPCPVAHLQAMLATMRALRDHAATAIAWFEDVPSPADKQAAVGYVCERWAAATTKAHYADDLWGGNHSPELHERIEQHAKEAVEQLYHLGQLLAMPALIEDELRRAATQPTLPQPQPHRWSLPGDPDFDPWQRTDPATREQWKQDLRAQAAIDMLWDNDPDPARTIQIQREIKAALARGDIAYATDRFGTRLGQ